MADDAADVDLCGDDDQRIRNLGLKFRIFIAILDFGIDVFLADFKAGRVYRLARLPLKSPDLYEFALFLFVLLNLRVQRSALFVGEGFVKQAGLTENRRVERKVLLAHLSEHLLAQPVQLVL